MRSGVWRCERALDVLLGMVVIGPSSVLICLVLICLLVRSQVPQTLPTHAASLARLLLRTHGRRPPSRVDRFGLEASGTPSPSSSRSSSAAIWR